MMGHDYNWTHNRYFKSDLERLRLKFSGAENIERNWSQVYQDMFVLSILDGKRNGTYLEIGGDDGKAISNTYLLETEFDWKGLAFEWLEGTENPTSGWKGYLANRKNPCLCEDATKADYAKLLKKYKFPKQIDFLQPLLIKQSLHGVCDLHLPWLMSSHSLHRLLSRLLLETIFEIVK